LLREFSGVQTYFVVGDPGWSGPAEVEGFGVRKVESRSERELLSVLDDDSQACGTILLHYEGYGYATRGCPAWLVGAVEKWRQNMQRRTLLTLFHELYATGPPWTSAFWLSAFQRTLTTRLAKTSDRCLTSLESYAAVVRRMSRKGTDLVNHLPVFSSIGEPKSVRPLAERKRRLVVFGTRGRRIEVYRRSTSAINWTCRYLEIEEIVDIGRAVEFDFANAFDVPVVERGELADEEVSELLLDSVAGMIDYPASMLGKSTIFAAYCSHRLMPIVATYGAGLEADGLEAGRHYWLSTNRAESAPLAWQAVADSALAWYQSHSLVMHERRLAACLGLDVRQSDRQEQEASCSSLKSALSA
jgi:hypothetical protein